MIATSSSIDIDVVSKTSSDPKDIPSRIKSTENYITGRARGNPSNYESDSLELQSQSPEGKLRTSV